MQIILLTITIVLSIILYRMLSSRRATYPFIRTTRIVRSEGNADYKSTASEHGLITIDKDVVIVEDQEYSLKGTKDNPAEAYLNLDNGKLISINIIFSNGEKQYYIDPEYGKYNAAYHSSLPDQSQHDLISF